ncbi:MAG: UDP-N-acetylmuramate--L-alanine ligase [Spirochaetales bacterium]|nr:UDP-N-acetylmuramate--L-alanine ligase [Spirochaetales bacterium]
MEQVFSTLKDCRCYLIGIKGTGMTALAQYLHRCGALVEGSDGSDIFYTDAILKKEGIPYFETFDACHIHNNTDVFVYSAAYTKETNPELNAAFQTGKPVLIYPEALGALTKGRFSVGIAGVHGKTTTTAITGTLIDEADIPGAVIVGSGVRNFGGSQVLYKGGDFLVAETCEYRRHFLHFSPDIILVTSIEPDHMDYFKDYEDICDAFKQYIRLLPRNGVLIYCAQDNGASELAQWVIKEHSHIRCIPYGGSENSPYAIMSEEIVDGVIRFRLGKFPDALFELKVPGHHTVLNAAGSIAAVTELMRMRYGCEPSAEILTRGLSRFFGTTRRSEILLKNDDYLIMDDYAHHPTAIAVTLKGLKEMYPGRRLVVSFMSHTYSRTNALFEEFCRSLMNADVVYLHRIYPSARETKAAGSVEGQDVFRRVSELGKTAFYYDQPHDSINHILSDLRPGDIFITLGAGDNWIISHTIAKKLENTQS